LDVGFLDVGFWDFEKHTSKMRSQSTVDLNEEFDKPGPAIPVQQKAAGFARNPAALN
jgi:hypothetical protein